MTYDITIEWSDGIRDSGYFDSFEAALEYAKDEHSRIGRIHDYPADLVIWRVTITETRAK
jgi:hypothetical protein